MLLGCFVFKFIGVLLWFCRRMIALFANENCPDRISGVIKKEGFFEGIVHVYINHIVPSRVEDGTIMEPL